MDNRRLFARVDHELLASYCHYDLNDVMDDEGMAKTLNMSVRGLLLLLPRSVDINSTLKVALNLEGSVIELVGQVMRCRLDPEADGMFDVGIELKYVPEHFAESVERYFAKS